MWCQNASDCSYSQLAFGYDLVRGSQVKTTPRKAPRQERAKATVETILAATARILVKHGYDGLTTNAVAAAAGVSIGSLYQYFPNKEALVAALIEDHIERMTAAIFSELSRVQALPLAAQVRAVIDLLIRAHSVEPKLQRVLTEQVPRVGRIGKILELDAIGQRMISGMLAMHKGTLAIRDPDLSAFILVTAVESICHRAVLFSPERLVDPRFVDETCLLVNRYLGIAEQ